jgi:hypothetical protein
VHRRTVHTDDRVGNLKPLTVQIVAGAADVLRVLSERDKLILVEACVKTTNKYDYKAISDF